MTSLNPNSATPLYLQLKQQLHRQIESGFYAIGARLPSERELAETYNVSRMTARQALLALGQDGLTSSRVGKGTFVSRSRLDQSLRELTSFSEDMARRGLQAGSKVIAASLTPAPEEVAAPLRLTIGTEVVVISRVRLADDKPVALETTCLNHHLCPEILKQGDFSRLSLYQVLRERYGHQLVWAEQTIEARLPNKLEQRELDLSPTMPVLSLTRTTFTATDQPIEYARSAYHGNAYQFRAILSTIDA